MTTSFESPKHIGWQSRRDWCEGEGFTDWKPIANCDVGAWQRRVAEDPSHFELRPVFAPIEHQDLARCLQQAGFEGGDTRLLLTLLQGKY